MRIICRFSMMSFLLMALAGWAYSQTPQPVPPKPVSPQPVSPQPVSPQPVSPQPTTPRPGVQPGQPLTGSGQPGQQPATGQPFNQPKTGQPQPGQPVTGSGQPGQPIPGSGQPGQPATGFPIPGRPLQPIAPVPNQPPSAGTDEGHGAIYLPPTPLFMDPVVRQHLRIADNQFNQLTAAHSQVQQQFRPRIAQVGNVSDAQGQARARDLTLAMNDSMRKSAATILTGEQLARYRQIELQHLGTVGAFNTPLVQQQLGFDQRQLDRFRELQQNYSQKLMALYPDLAANRNNAFFKLSALRADFDRQWEAVLTPQQRQAWSGMLGRPFDFQYQP